MLERATPPQRRVLLAALMAMVSDMHTLQDTLSQEDWAAAEELLKQLLDDADRAIGTD